MVALFFRVSKPLDGNCNPANRREREGLYDTELLIVTVNPFFPAELRGRDKETGSVLHGVNTASGSSVDDSG
jgi:hypothetical protein